MRCPACVLNSPRVPLAQICKKVFAYIFEKKLNSTTSSVIELDDTLGTFLTAPVSTYTLPEQLFKHIWPAGAIQGQPAFEYLDACCVTR